MPAESKKQRAAVKRRRDEQLTTGERATDTLVQSALSVSRSSFPTLPG
ncbi:MAG TPA: hypothetical protein VGC89_19535 [Pyrinomonadaceae bacterium]